MKPISTIAPGHPDAEPTVWELCREWRLVNAKLAYDLARLPDNMEAADKTDRLVDEAGGRTDAIEEALAMSAIESFDDAQSILGVVGQNMDSDNVGRRDRDLVSAVIRALNLLRNKTSGEAA